MDSLDVRPNSQASTARLSSKSGEDADVEENMAVGSGDVADNEDPKLRQDSISSKSMSIKSLNENGNGEVNKGTGVAIDAEVNEEDKLSNKSQDGEIHTESGAAGAEVKEEDKESTKSPDKEVRSESRKSEKSSSSKVRDEGTSSLSRQNSQASEKAQEETIVLETEVPVSAIPIEKRDSPKEDDKEYEKENSGKKSQLSVELPPEEKEAISSTPPAGGNSGQASVHHTPTPMPPVADTPPPPSSEGTPTPAVEAPIEATITTPQESGGDENQDKTGDLIGNSPSSPDGKHDSAISSSSMSPDKMEETTDGQETPIVEVT